MRTQACCGRRSFRLRWRSLHVPCDFIIPLHLPSQQSHVFLCSTRAGIEVSSRIRFALHLACHCIQNSMLAKRGVTACGIAGIQRVGTCMSCFRILHMVYLRHDRDSAGPISYMSHRQKVSCLLQAHWCKGCFLAVCLVLVCL